MITRLVTFRSFVRADRSRALPAITPGFDGGSGRHFAFAFVTIFFSEGKVYSVSERVAARMIHSGAPCALRKVTDFTGETEESTGNAEA